MDEIAAEDHSYIATAAERARRENTCVLVLNSEDQTDPWIEEKIKLGGHKS